MVSIVDMNTEIQNSILVRVSRFCSERYAYRGQPGDFVELIAFGLVVFVAVWPITLVALALAVVPK
jgi:hypothetical protein